MNIVLIGLGMVAKTHVHAIAATHGALRLKGVFARNSERAKAFVCDISANHDDKPLIYPTIESIASDADVDFAIVATPPNARQDICRIMAEAGKPVLMEKPVERNAASADAIVGLFEKARVPLGIVFQHRARESSAKLSTLIQGGTLGAVSVVDISVPWWRDQAYYDEPGRGTFERDGGGVLISQAIHTLDLALSLVGPVASVQAMARSTSLHRLEAEDYVSAGLEFNSGAIGSLVASTASYPGGAESIVLHCENASVTLVSGTLKIHWRDGRTETFGETASTGGGVDPMAFTHEWHQIIIENFAEVVENGSAPMASGREAMHVHHLIDALIMSSREKRAIDVQNSTNLVEANS